jgi:hypothetical protein
VSGSRLRAAGAWEHWNIVRPRRLLGASGRPLNLIVRQHQGVQW